MQSWWVKSRRAQNPDDYETWIAGGVSPTLNAFDNGNDTRATVIIFENSYRDGPRIGKGISHTLPAKMGTGGGNTPMIAQPIPIQGTIIGRSDTAGPGGPGYGNEGDPMYTLDTVSQHGVVAPSLTASNNPSRSPQSSEVTQQVGAVFKATAVVRRLTPIECERLMGWPDNHTLHRTDGKTNSDSTRYKMCGNGVATPVAHWIATQLKDLLT